MLLRLLTFAILLQASIASAVDPDLANAEKLFRAGKADEAKRIVSGYVTNHENGAGYINVGSLYARLKMWPESVHYLEIATNRDPRNALAYYELGLAQHQNKQVNEAVDSLRHSLSISTTGKTYWALGQMLELSGDRFDARNNYMTALKKIGDQANVRNRLCWLFFRDNFFAEAVKQCSAAVKLNPNDADSWAILARAQFENHDKTQAFATFRTALLKHPKSAILYQARGLIYLEEKSYEQASIDLGKAFGLNPESDEAAIGLARSLFESGRYSDALPLFVEACKMDRNYRFEFLAKQRELGRKGKDELAEKYQAAVDRF